MQKTNCSGIPARNGQFGRIDNLIVCGAFSSDWCAVHTLPRLSIKQDNRRDFGSVLFFGKGFDAAGISK